MEPEALICAALRLMFRVDAPERLFGDWKQPITEIISPTPVGAPCFVCNVAIADGDLGELFERRDSGILEPIHLDCLALLFFGHQVQVCGCTQFAGCIDANGRPNFRNAARIAAERVQARLRLGLGLEALRPPKGPPS